MTPAIRIRPITEQDVDGFQAAVDTVARERLYLSAPKGPDIEAARVFVRNNIATGNPQFVALAGDLLIGWCDICRSQGAFEQHVGSMGMGLLPDWRNRGLGRDLLQATLDQAPGVGITRVELSVHAGNARAIALYHRLGFEQEGRLRQARQIDDRLEDIILMARFNPSS